MYTIPLSNHVYGKRSLKIKDHLNVKWNGGCKGPFYINIHKHFTLTKTLSSMFMQSLQWIGNHGLETTPSHEIPTQQKHDHFPLWLFFNILYSSSNRMAHVSRGRYTCWLGVYSYFTRKIHTREIMNANASNNTASYTHVSSYVAWDVHPLGPLWTFKCT